MSDPELSISSPLMEMCDATIASLRDSSRIMIEQVNWSARVGDFWVIAGLLGSGKTDFLSVAAGIMRPLRGSYRLFGRELIPGFEDELLPERLRVGLVFDGGQLLSHLTITENVSLALRYHQNCRSEEVAECVEAMLALLQLTPLALRYPGDISRNWRQRAGLARALMLRPEVLLLDCPLTGLDPWDAQWWLDFLAQLAAGHRVTDGRPVTLAVTGDDLRPWRTRARQFAVLKNRRLVTRASFSDHATRDEVLLQELLGAG